MSLIDHRLVCPDCSGYRAPYRTNLSSVCTCPGHAPVNPGRHQIGAPRTGPLPMSGTIVRGGRDE